MKGIWQVSPLDRAVPQWDLLRRAACTRVYYAARYPTYENGKWAWHDNTTQLTPDYRALTVRELGTRTSYGIFRDPHWDNITDAGAIALAMHEDLDRATGGNKYLAAPYFLDMEWHSPDLMLAILRAFRRLRPSRWLAWTLEPLQGGWIGGYRPLVDAINADPNFWIVPQTFYGDMTPVDPSRVRFDIERAGINAAKVLLFYDAAKPRPFAWNGCLFHAERLVVSTAAITEAPETVGIDLLLKWRIERFRDEQRRIEV